MCAAVVYKTWEQERKYSGNIHILVVNSLLGISQVQKLNDSKLIYGDCAATNMSSLGVQSLTIMNGFVNMVRAKR